MVFGAAGAAQTPKIDDLRPAKKTCIKNPSLKARAGSVLLPALRGSISTLRVRTSALAGLSRDQVLHVKLWKPFKTKRPATNYHY